MPRATSGTGEPYSTTIVMSTVTILPSRSTRTPLVKLRVLRRENMSASPEDGELMLETPSTSVAAKPAMVATTSVANDTVPSGFSSSLTSDG